MRRSLFFFLLFLGLTSPLARAFPAGRYTVKGTGNTSAVIEISVSVPNGNTQTVTVTGGRILGSNIVAATPAEARKDDEVLRARLRVTVEDSFGRLRTYIVELEAGHADFRNRNPDDQVGSYHEPGSNIVHVLTA